MTTPPYPPDTIRRYHELIEELGPDVMKQRLAQMHLIRAFDTRLDQMYIMGQTYGTLHLSIGQEATNVGALTALREDDYFFSHHRGHGHALVWLDDPNRIMADVLGKVGGYSDGRGGTMHIADFERGALGGNGIVGGGLPMAAGVGLSIKVRQTTQVCMTIFGDGAVNEGAFHESMNLASIWELPVIFLCENNQYAMSTPTTSAFNIPQLSQRADAYGIPGITVDGNDLMAVYLAVRDATARARSGNGPTFVEAVTYRIKGHSRSDKQAYRTRDEVRSWQAPERDPITRFATLLEQAGVLGEGEHDAIEAAAKDRVEQAVAFANDSPDPDPGAVEDNVYA